MEASKPPKNKKRCEVCNIEILSSSFAKHLGSKNHQKNASRQHANASRQHADASLVEHLEQNISGGALIQYSLNEPYNVEVDWEHPQNLNVSLIVSSSDIINLDDIKPIIIRLANTYIRNINNQTKFKYEIILECNFSHPTSSPQNIFIRSGCSKT